MNQKGLAGVLLLLLLVLIVGVGGAYFLLPKKENVNPQYTDQLQPKVRTQVVMQEKEKIEASDEVKQKVAEFNLDDLIPAVVSLECYFAGESEPRGGGSGSSVYDPETKEHKVYTNAHVVRDSEDGVVADGCWVYFPDENGSFYKSTYWAGQVVPLDNHMVKIDGIEVGGNSYLEGGVDFAVLWITEPGIDPDGKEYPFPIKFPDVNKAVERTCATEVTPKIGDKMFILGYPAVGGSSMTVTEGIISGFEGSFSEWIKTSAQIAAGHSGGLAVLAQNGCPLGIPTLAYSNALRVENIGRVLSYGFINDFLNQIPKTEQVDE